MKKLSLLALVPALAGVFVFDSHSLAGNPGVGAAIARQFGESQLRNVVLITSAADDEDPEEWRVYSLDPYRPGEQLRATVTKQDGRWEAAPDSAGRLLKRVPRLPLDFKRLRVDSKEARRIVTKAAASAMVEFETMNFQLAANDVTGAPEWGIALQDDAGFEVGFCVVSGETGLILSEDLPQNIAIEPFKAQTSVAQEGAAAAKRVKQGVRKAWSWTENAGRKTGGFFRELFR